MKDQINTIREALTAALSDDQPYIEACKQALTALSELEAMVGEQEPVAYAIFAENGNIRLWSTESQHVKRIAQEKGLSLVPLYAAPVAQQHKTVTNDEQASAYMDARLWEFIDMAGMWPKAKPDPRIWAHVMVYAPPPQQAEAVPTGFKLLKDTTHDERSWPEDYSHENGCYSNTCINCLRNFTGYKRRAVCKVCDAAIAQQKGASHE